MDTFASLPSVRRTRLAKFFAACLIALATSPFTAPFATCDVADLSGEAPLHGGSLASKTAPDVADTPVGGAAISPDRVGVIVPWGDSAPRTHSRATLRVVLRI